MSLQIHDAALEKKLQRQIETTGARSIEEVVARLLETQEEQDRWLHEDLAAVSLQIQRGIDQLDRGEGILEKDLPAYLAKLKSQAE